MLDIIKSIGYVIGFVLLVLVILVVAAGIAYSIPVAIWGVELDPTIMQDGVLLFLLALSVLRVLTRILAFLQRKLAL